jgi:hypothetical protein
MSEVRNKANNLSPYLGWPFPGANNSSQGFRDITNLNQQALFQASDELDKIQKTYLRFSGDAAGSSPVIGQAVVVGSANPVLDVSVTLASVYTGTMTLDTRSKDVQITLDSKGRVISTTLTDHSINFATGHSINNPIAPEGLNIGSGTGSIELPTFTFNAMGRLVATGKQTINYGLFDMTLPTGSLLVGGTNNRSTSFAAPTGNGSYSLVFSGGALNWAAVSTGTMTGIVAGAGIEVINDPNAPTVQLNINNTQTSSAIEAGDFFVWHDNTDNLPKKITAGALSTMFATDIEVVKDTSPELGGNLDLKNFIIYSSNAAGVKLQSALASPKSTVSVKEDGITLSGSAGAPIVLTAPSIALNGLSWPTTVGTDGQYLTKGPSGTLVWTTPAQFYQIIPNTIFVGGAGNDTDGNGSLNNPYQTIAKALSVIPTNDTNNIYTVMLLGGTYTEEVAISNISNIAFEGFFGSTKSIIKGHFQVQFNVNRFLMSNISVDTSDDELDNFQPTFAIFAGLESAEFRDCEFLRGQGDKSNMPVMNLAGIIVGDVTFYNSTIQGRIVNNMNSDDGGRLVLQNCGLPTNGWLGLEVTNRTNTFISGAPLMKGIRHDGGVLNMENIGAIMSETYTVYLENPSLPVWENGEPVFVLDENGDPIDYMDGNGNIQEVALLDENGDTIEDPDNEGEILTTHYVQVLQSQPDTEVTYDVGLYSTADETSGEDTLLELNNVIFYHNGEFTKLYKSGSCKWSFNRVKRRSDQDFIAGPRIAYDVQPDEGQFLAHYTASGNNLRYADDNSVVNGGVIDPNAGKCFHVQLTGSANIRIKTPEVSAYSPGPILTSGEMYAEVLVVIKQDATGGRNVMFQDDLSQGITWIGASDANNTADASTFFLFRYFSKSRKWIAWKQVDDSVVRITTANNVNYILTANDANSYVRRNNDAANTVTVPTASSVRFAVGTQIQVIQAGNGKTSILPAAGVTINTPYGFELRGKMSRVLLTKISNNTWDLTGDLDVTDTPSGATTIDSDSITVDSDDVTADNG